MQRNLISCHQLINNNDCLIKAIAIPYPISFIITKEIIEIHNNSCNGLSGQCK